MAGQRPRQGWVYMINPYRVSLRCSSGHSHIYDLDTPGEIECKTLSCTLTINSSRVFRGSHPYVIWTSDKFQDQSGYIQTFTAIPLTSQATFSGLPTTYPINNTARNGLDKKSYALVHQICTVDGNCFKDSSGNWLQREGQLDSKDKDEIAKRLKFILGFDSSPDEDWFKQNASPELVQKIYGYLSDAEKSALLESLVDNFE
ncbi:MAG: type II toxin-antitoxin system PemK/MazF family toxin [Desertifilum sp.]|nr:type II toxin-antitoxin system PemK/MazF family toxin [Desertifilum sp.]